MTPLPPMTVAKWGVYGAALFAALRAWLGLRAGGTWDYVLLRAVFVFILLTVLVLALEAAVTLLPPRPEEPRPSKGAQGTEAAEGGEQQ